MPPEEAHVAAYLPAVVAAYPLTLDDSLRSFPWPSVAAVFAEGEEKQASDAGAEGSESLVVVDFEFVLASSLA